MFYYQHHIGDFIKDTANLDDHQLATYLRMMWIYYTDEKPFDDDAEGIAFAVRSDEKTVRLLLRHFFDKTVDKWHHNRCDREINGYKEKSEKARGSANARWSNAKAMRTHNERNADEPVLDANQEPNNLITKDKGKTETGISLDKPAKRKQKIPMPDDFSISDSVRDWAKKQGLDRLDEHLDAFKRKAEMNGYRYINWDLAFMEAIREDWAKLRGKQSFAQQAADVARSTVPASPRQSEALKQIEDDLKKAVPPPAHIREMMKGILGVKNA